MYSPNINTLPTFCLTVWK